MTKILIPLQKPEPEMENSLVATHFGKAPYFAVVELDLEKNNANITLETNNSSPAGGTEDLEGTILELKPDVIIAYFMGPNIADTFRSLKIKLLRACGATLKENLEQYMRSNLQNLSANCPGHQ